MKPPTPPAAESALTDRWLIWSMEHRSFWAPYCNGYVVSLKNAGRYSFEEAAAIVRDGNYGAPPDKPHEAMIADGPAVNAHAAARQRIVELEKALDGIVDLYVSGYLKPEADGPARFYHAFKQARLALRHPERT